MLGAPVTLLLVATTLSGSERGFYFSFINLQAFAQVLEQGCGAVLVYFVSHEFGRLTWTPHGTLSGDARSLRKVGQVFAGAICEYGRLARLAAAVAIAVGALLFRNARADASLTLGIPWVLLALFTAFYATVVPRLMVLEGAGELYRVQRMRWAQIALDLICLWCLIPVVGAPIAVAAMSALHLSIAYTWADIRYRPLWRQLRQVESSSDPAEGHVVWTREVWPVQWRTGLIWTSGYVTYQCLTPLALLHDGPVAAGRLGLSLALATAPYMVGLAWLQSRLPSYSVHLGRGDHEGLTRLAKKTTAHAMIVCGIASIMVVGLVGIWFQVSVRAPTMLLSVGAIVLLCLAALANLATHAIGTYLRAFRVELYGWLSVVSAILTLLASWIGALTVGVVGVAFGYAGVAILVTLPLAVRILRRHLGSGIAAGRLADTSIQFIIPPS